MANENSLAQEAVLPRLVPAWRRAAVLALLCALTFAVYPLTARVALGEWAFPFDDPWTHQVYARNLAEYGQYAFNVGQSSTGSSAPLWTFLMVPAYWLGISPVIWAALLGLLSLAALGATAWAWAETHFPPPWPLLVTVAILLTPQLAWGSVEGMESVPAAALGLFILWRLERIPRPASREVLLDGAMNGLLLWLRPEAPLLMLIFAWQRRRAGWKKLLVLAAGYLLLAVPYVAFNLAIGGKPLPQTFYAKAAYYGQATSLAKILSFLQGLLLAFAPGIWPLVIVLVLVAVVQMARRRRWTWGPGLTWAGLTVLLAALRLPVVLHFGRHFIPVLPPLLLAAGEGVHSLGRISRRVALGVGAAFLLIGLVVGISFYLGSCRTIVETQESMGRWIAANLPAGAAVATHDIGAIGYFGRHPLVDTMALITPELTEVVAREDQAGLALYLRRHNVYYMASFDRLYPEVKKALDAWVVVKAGQMELVRLR